MPCFLVLLFFLCLAQDGESGKEEGLYDVLGVSRKADQKEIRSAYKKLAREWHPDKNKSPRAQEKILEINEAYEVLSGEESRRHYDMTGETEPAPSRGQGHAHNQGFTFFQAGNGHFHFHFGGSGGFGHSAHQRKDTITAQYFKTTVLPESSRKLWLLNFFNDFCMQCGEVARIWDELREELQSLGVGMGSVHGSYHYAVASHCNIDRVPAIVAIVNKRTFHYYGQLQARSIRNFVKSTIPTWVVTELNSGTIRSFISGSIEVNKPRLILFSPHPQPSLLYKAVAFSNQPVADFGFVSTEKGSGNSLEVLKQFGVSWRSKKLMVFKEYPIPSVVIEESQLTSDMLKSVVEGVKLHLPRISSQSIMEDTCGNDERMCLILVVSGVKSYNGSTTSAFRAKAVELTTAVNKARLSMAYIDKEKQHTFLSNFENKQTSLKYCTNGEESRYVLLLRRKTGFHTLYDWFNDYCGSKEDWENLFSFATETSLRRATGISNVEDEFAPGVVSRLWYSVTEIWYDIYDYSLANFQTLSLLVMTCGMAAMLCCASLIGAGQSMDEQETRKQPRKGSSPHSVTGRAAPTVIPALDSELYHQYVEHASKGSIAVLLLADSLSEDFLQVFSETVQKHKSRRFRFFHGLLEDNRLWFQDLLERSNMKSREKELMECLYFREDLYSTVCVLALFGAKKQFAIFPEIANSSRYLSANGHSASSSESVMNEGVREERSSKDNVMDSVMSSFGFEDEDSSSERGEAIDKGFAVWMERLEDGSLKRYSTEHWPHWH